MIRLSERGLDIKMSREIKCSLLKAEFSEPGTRKTSRTMYKDYQEDKSQVLRRKIDFLTSSD